MLIAIEGMDGSGKTSVAKAVADELQAVLIEFPCRTDTVTGPLIDEYLKQMWTVYGGDQAPHGKLQRQEGAAALAFQALMVTNRLECMPAIKAVLDAGRHVVCSRYWQSGWVYGQIDGLDKGFLRLIHLSMIHADVNILLDVGAEEGFRRRAERDGTDLKPERYEAKVEMMQQANWLYRDLWKDVENRWGFRGIWSHVDAHQDFNAVVAEILKLAVGRKMT